MGGCPRGLISLAVLALALGSPAVAQSVISTHAGLVYFFEGSVFVGDQELEQKFGNFPDIGEGRELRTARGRAEILLTPGVFLRIDENSSIRMRSTRLSDARVELLGGSAILESGEPVKGTSVTLIYKSWQVRLPRQGVYRIDAEPAQVQVYSGEAEVSAAKEPDNAVSVKEAQLLPLAAVLVPEQKPVLSDGFKTWAMSRSQAISADNAVAAEILDDPSQSDMGGLTVGGFTWFPPTSYPSLGINSPYGVSFWSPFQTGLTASCYQPYLYGLYSGWPGPCSYPQTVILTAWPASGGLRFGGLNGLNPPRVPFRPAPIRPLYGHGYTIPNRNLSPTRTIITAPRPVPPPHITAPIVVHK